MLVNVVISFEEQVDVDEKFAVMDLDECSDEWDNIPTSLQKELLRIAEDEISSLHPELHEIEFEVERIYHSDSFNDLYTKGCF
jgi:hypothetical protein